MAEDTSWDNIGTGDGGPYSEWDSGDNNYVNDLYSNDYNNFTPDYSMSVGDSGSGYNSFSSGMENFNPAYSTFATAPFSGYTQLSDTLYGNGTANGTPFVSNDYEEDQRKQRTQGSIWDRIVNSATSPEGLGKLGAGLASLFTKNKLAGQLRSNTDYLANRADPIGAALRGQAQGQASAILNDGGASNPMVQAAMRQAQEALLRTNSRNRYAASPMIADQLAAKQFELGQTQLNNLTRLLSNNADYRAVGSGLDKAAEAEANKYNGLATAIGDITRGSSGSDAKTIADTIIASLKGVK